MSNGLDDRLLFKWIQHLDITASYVGDVAGDKDEAMHARGCGKRPIPLVLVFFAEKPGPLGHDWSINGDEPAAIRSFQRVERGESCRGKCRVVLFSALPSPPLLEKRHDADPQIGIRHGSVPGTNKTIAFGVHLPQHILVQQINRHGIRCGVIGSSPFSTSQTPDSAMSLSILLKLRAGNGRPGFG